MICAFCPARACDGLTALAACGAHWDDPERAAGELEDRARAASAEVERLSSQLRIATEALEAIVERGNERGSWVLADDALTQMSVAEDDARRGT